MDRQAVPEESSEAIHDVTTKDLHTSSAANFGFSSSTKFSDGLRELKESSHVKVSSEKIGNRRVPKSENYIDLLHLWFFFKLLQNF